MGRVRNIILCTLLLAGFTGPANFGLASSKSPPEFRAVNNVALAIKLNLEANNTVPTSWQQITQYCDVNRWNRQLSSSGKIFVLQEYYVFITNKWIVSQARSRQAILVRNQPRVTYEGNVGRYLVCWNGSYEETLWMPEEDFQKSLQQSGIALPDPDLTEVATAKAAVEARVAQEQIEHHIIVAAAPKPTWEDIGAVWWMRLKAWFFVYTEHGRFTGKPRPLGIFVGLGLFALVIYVCRGKRT